LPDETLLTYGTSITQGAFASRYPMSYGHQTARHLGADHVNLGSGGSAFCEEAVAEYIAGRDDWDRAVLSVSVNMIAVGFDADEFGERAVTLVETVAGAHPEKPIAAVTLFPLFDELCPGVDGSDEWEATPAEYRQRLRDAVAAADRPNLHLIEGPDLLQDPGGLSTDLLHPMDHGMTEIAHRLADRLESL
jgi:lysophospholipase L1-like esterase